MNVFNRVVVIALLVFAIVAGLVIATRPEAILTFLQDWTRDAVVTPQDKVASIVLGAALVIASALVIYFELRPPRGRTVLVSKLAGGRAELELPTVAERIRQAVVTLDGVRQAWPHITARGHNIDLRLVVLTANEVDVPEKAAEIDTTVRDCVAKMGVGMGRQRIQFRSDSPRSPKAG